LTATRHKSLVPVCNRPAIAYLFDWLKASGMSRVVLALGQQNDDLAVAYPPGSLEGLDLVFVREEQRLESGGAIRNAVRAAGVEGRFTVLNGDVFVEFDFRRALAAHIEREADLTLALYPVADPSAFGVAVVDEMSNVTGFIEKPPRESAPGNLVNAGVWIFEPGLVDEIPPGAVRVEETLFPSLVARRRRVLGYQFAGTWADIGTHERYLELNQALLARRGRPEIHSTARVAGDATVAASAIGAGSRIGSHASVTGSVLWEDVAVGEGAVVSGSILADGVRVGDGATVDGCVLGQGVSVEATATLPRGTLMEPRARYDAKP
jgi:mannose-1-phosphate guanylyltransferase